MASISSIKIIAGAFSLANMNISRSTLGPSGRYFRTNSEPTTRMNAAVVLWATALANNVFLQPDSSYISTPPGVSIPVCF